MPRLAPARPACPEGGCCGDPSPPSSRPLRRALQGRDLLRPLASQPRRQGGRGAVLPPSHLARERSRRARPPSRHCSSRGRPCQRSAPARPPCASAGIPRAIPLPGALPAALLAGSTRAAAAAAAAPVPRSGPALAAAPAAGQERGGSAAPAPARSSALPPARRAGRERPGSSSSGGRGSAVLMLLSTGAGAGVPGRGAVTPRLPSAPRRSVTERSGGLPSRRAGVFCTWSVEERRLSQLPPLPQVRPAWQGVSPFLPSLDVKRRRSLSRVWLCTQGMWNSKIPQFPWGKGFCGKSFITVSRRKKLAVCLALV